MAQKKMEALDEQIRKAEEEVIKLGERYNAACDKLKELRAKRSAIQHDKLINAFVKSGKTYEEVMLFLGDSSDDVGDENRPVKRRGRRPKSEE